MKTILVTGHNGFIGSHVLSNFSSKFNIIGLSNKKTNNSKITEIKKNILSISEEELPPKIFCIFHLAAITDVRFCNENPTKCFKINTLGTQNVLEIARKKKSKLIFFSTSHVFGNPRKLPLSERSERIPSSIYSSSKHAAEILCESYSRTYGLDVSIARLFSVYGPNSPNHLVTTRIIHQLLKGDTLTLGNLKPKRDFIFIDDVISALEIILKNTKGFNTFNIGSGKSYSINTVCKLLSEISNKKIKIKSQVGFSRTNDIPNIVADHSKLKKIGWKPKISLKQGLGTTFEWFMSNT